MAVRPSPSLSTPVDSALDGVESSLTDRYQTTVPQPVRRALGLGKRDRIRYCFRANGEVVLQRVSPQAEEDPALAPFLALARAGHQPPPRTPSAHHRRSGGPSPQPGR